MLEFILGQKYDQFKKNGIEGPMFDLIEPNFGLLMYYTNNPADDFVKKFSKIESIEIGLKYYHKQIMIIMKLGEMGYVDMVYTPQLSSNVPMEELRNLEEPQTGMNIILLLLNSMTGEVLNIQALGTNVKFYQEFVKAVKDKMNTEYSKEEDQKQLKNIYALYPDSRKLAEAADVLFKINK